MEDFKHSLRLSGLYACLLHVLYAGSILGGGRSNAHFHWILLYRCHLFCASSLDLGLCFVWSYFRRVSESLERHSASAPPLHQTWRAPGFLVWHLPRWWWPFARHWTQYHGFFETISSTCRDAPASFTENNRGTPTSPRRGRAVIFIVRENTYCDKTGLKFASTTRAFSSSEEFSVEHKEPVEVSTPLFFDTQDESVDKASWSS